MPIYGSASIAGITHALDGGNIINIPHFGRFLVLDISGHTKIHLAFYHFAGKVLFCSDCLFSAGCGRIFDGDALSFYHSITKISLLADDTIMCPAHEYTLSNLQFALAVEPNNQDSKDYQQQCLLLRQQHRPTLPTLLGKEKRLNPFLRCHLLVKEISALTQQSCHTSAQGFAALRRYKNDWQSSNLL